MNKKNIAKVIYIISAIIIMVVCCIPFYFSTDARYARDNLAYLSKEMETKGVASSVDTSGFNAFKYPYPIAISLICNMADSWTVGYLKTIENNAEITGFYDMSLQTNPYDTLSRLVYSTTDPDINTAYTLVKYDTAILNPESSITRNTIVQWNSETSDLLEKEQQAIKNMEFYMILCAGFSIMYSIPVIFIFISFLIKKKNLLVFILKKIIHI